MKKSKIFLQVFSKEFKEARERYQRAERLMMYKENMKRDLPPPGSSFYRYFIDPKRNPPSYHEQCRRIDSLTYEQVFGEI